MIRQLVVGVDGSENSLAAFGYGEYFAARLGCELKAVFVLDSRKTELPFIYVTGHFDYAFAHPYLTPDAELKNFYLRLKKDLNTFADSCLEACAGRCRAKGIPFIPLKREGLPSAVLSEESRSGDLLLIGQRGENARLPRTIAGSTTEDIARSSPRPLLLCPNSFRPPRKLLFPYDGSITAERALQFSLNMFSSFWRECVILLVGIERPEALIAEAELRYFKHHQVGYRTVMEKGSPVEAVLRVAEREGSDIILVGSHGAGKIKDYLLGSTTVHLIRKSPLPILIVY